jgi:hypothetical protein
LTSQSPFGPAALATGAALLRMLLGHLCADRRRDAGKLLLNFALKLARRPVPAGALTQAADHRG